MFGDDGDAAPQDLTRCAAAYLHANCAHCHRPGGLASATLDLSGRPYFLFEGGFARERVGDLPTELVPHFFHSLCQSAGITLHLAVRGDNAHHQVEACFKAVARALRIALRRDGDALPSSKGVL